MAGKRKRPGNKAATPEEQYRSERAERYASLVNVCQKTIRREGKTVRAFEVQKMVRRLKALERPAGGGGDAGADGDGDAACGDGGSGRRTQKQEEKRRRQAARLEYRLRIAKAYDLERLVDVCSRRTGLPNLAPPPPPDGEAGGGGDGSGDAGAGGPGPGLGRDGDGEEESVQQPPGGGGSGASGGLGKDDGEKEGADSRTEEVDGRLPGDGKNGDNDDDVDDEAVLSQLTESMLRHKRLVDAVDGLNERITEHRRWILRREEHLFGGGGFPADPPGGGRSGKAGKKRRPGGGAGGRPGRGGERPDPTSGHAGSSGLFIGSLSGGGGDDGGSGNGAADGGGSGCDHYGPGGHHDGPWGDGDAAKKKNRPGQRARKAKAMAIEARKEGRRWDSSVNWREKKTKKGPPVQGGGGSGPVAVAAPLASASGLKAGAKVGASDVARMGKDWQEEGKAHPSWAARQAQKEKSGVGIVQFTGKKITFD